MPRVYFFFKRKTAYEMRISYWSSDVCSSDLIIPEHLANKGLGLHNDLQNESSIVGNFPTILMMRDFGTEEQKAERMPGFMDGTRRLAFGLTEPNHGSDANSLETTAVADGNAWVIKGNKRGNYGLHHAPTASDLPSTMIDPGAPQ